MSYVKRCDICERTKMDGIIFENYKVKQRKHLWNGTEYFSGWEEIDICKDCLEKIRKGVRKGGVSDETD